MKKFEVTMFITLKDEPEYDIQEIINKMADVAYQLDADDISGRQRVVA